VKCETDTVDLEQIPKSAKALEHLLFKQKRSIHEYLDLSTLDSRLRVIMSVKVQRRMCTSAQNNRSLALHKLLGLKRYKYVRDLVKDINMAKMKMTASLKCNGDTCGMGFRKYLPHQVRLLFFETRLVQAFQKHPVERLLQGVDWSAMIEEAEGNLLLFEEWAGCQA
jgi:hypothetical protein